MWTCAFLLILLLCPAPALAQTVPDFSGVFLRNPLGSHDPFTELTGFEDPLVLNIKQGVDTLQVTEMQNGAQRKRVYDLSGKPSINVSPGGIRSQDRIRFKGDTLLIESEVADSRSTFIGLLGEWIWKLSPDLRTLTIRLRDSRQMETYARQASLAVALDKAREASGMNKCNGSPPAGAKPPTPKLNQGVFLGSTGFQQLEWQVYFQAGLGGEFFDDLRRTNAPGIVEFRKNGKPVSTYSGSLILEVSPRVISDMRMDLSPLQTLVGNERLPDWLLTLRFRIKWIGSESRDLGEVPSDLRQEPWTELRTPEKWYLLEIPAQDVPITDSLEIHILSADGNQLGCISGHI